MGHLSMCFSFIRIVPLALIGVLLSHCKVSSGVDSSLEAANESGEMADLRWLEKASRALRFGKSLTPNDPMRSYVDQPKSTAVDALMKDPLFFPTMVDFYSFYYGFKSDGGVQKNPANSRIIYDPKTKIIRFGLNAPDQECAKNPNCVDYKSNYRLNFQLSGHPAILSAATAVVDDKNLDVLFRPKQPSYLPVENLQDLVMSLIFLAQPPSKRESASLDKLPPVSLDELFKNTRNSLAKFSQLINTTLERYPGTRSDTNPSVKDFCKDFIKLATDLDTLFALGSLIDLSFAATCARPDDPPLASVKFIGERLAATQKSVEEVFVLIEDFLKMKLKVLHGTYIDASSYLKTAPKSQLFDATFWDNHQNSSTNFNRRRAAYVFKTFFCDDLTPVKLEVAKDPSDHRHGSDPSCMACHYKLDPIAGFFRDYGVAGINFRSASSFAFDDSKQISGKELEKYRASWDFPGKKGPNQGQNIGLVRSMTDLTKNSYGTTLEDLGRLIAQDPRTYSCKTQRLADYFIGGGQTYDREWIDQLAKAMSTPTKSPNGQSVKLTIKKILLSKSFSVQNPEDGVCYDRADSSKSTSQMDCRVASTMAKYCTKCHGAESDNGGLDLSDWTETRGFRHLDEGGKLFPKLMSYQRILERLGPSDLGPMMPLNSPMPDPDRHIIRQWFEGKIQKSK